MTSYTNTTPYFWLVGIFAGLLLVATPAKVDAQVFVQNFSPQTQQELVAYIYGLIAQQQGLGFTPSGSVLGVSASSVGLSPVEVTTFEASNVSEDEAWVWGEIDLNGAAFATVWFEYGESRSLGDVSRSGRIDNRTSDTFRGDLDDLDRDEEYFYRAVAEDPFGQRAFGTIKSFETTGRSRSSNNNDDEPEATIRSATDIRSTSAELRGEVDMNDFNNGLVFFAYGEDEDDVEDVSDEDEFRDIDEQSDDLQLIIVDRDLDSDDTFERRISGLDRNTDIYFRICVEYEDEDDDETLECSQVREFETDGSSSNSGDDEPDVITQSAFNIDDDRAEVRGEVDMNDFNNGLVFFVFGEDEDEVEDVEDEDSFGDIDERGDDLQKFSVDRDLDDDESYTARLFDLDDNTDHFFRLCVEYEDEDDDETLECGQVREFETD